MSGLSTPHTPMMAQYMEIKADHPDALLFYRMGDFYELFFDDAVAASEALDIALTKRGKDQGNDIAMCGVPYHAADGYLHTLIRKGFRVAVCEQLESPAEAKKRGAKSVVRRGVVRLVTPGTLTEEGLLEARRNNFLAAFAKVRHASALAWVDISTGEMLVCECPEVRLGADLTRIGASELVIAQRDVAPLTAALEDTKVHITPLGDSAFDSQGAQQRLCSFYNVADLQAFGTFSREQVSALGALLDYLEVTQKGNLPLIRPPRQVFSDAIMAIDATTRQSLEITQTHDGGPKGSLLATIDRTVTAAGGRLIERRLSEPSCELPLIGARQDGVTWAMESDQREEIRSILRRVGDLERSLSRLSLGRGGPRDLAAVRNALQQAVLLSCHPKRDHLPELLAAASGAFLGHEEVLDLLFRALVEEPPLLVRDGGFIAADFDPEIDELRRLRDEGRTVIAGLQAQYASLADISTLKIKHNNVLGYFIETTKIHADKMLGPPLSETFIHRQTTANVVRFTTVELSELQTRIHTASADVERLESALFASLCEAVLDKSDALYKVAAGLAEWDVACALADVALEYSWNRPELTTGREFDIRGGRHPVVEAALFQGGGRSFIANDCALDDGGIWLLTGPNMAGKSTFLRQNALIAVLAQAGSFVPAQSAKIGLVTQLFSRVGASDDLARGRSTFMVEMVETAAILNQASKNALVIVDEIGRGTSTYDGLSIAWATLEHLHDVNGCRALFATHYHELTQLHSRLGRLTNASVAVREWEGDVIFLYEVRREAADRSYGVQVAKLAGLPPPVIARASEVLAFLESSERDTKQGAPVEGLPLFAAQRPTESKRPTGPSPLERTIDDIQPDTLSPREALDLIYELKSMKDDKG